MKLAKYVVAVLVLLVAGYVTLFYFSATESCFACDGTMTSKGTGTASKVFVRLQEYRWWVKLWSTSQGSLWLCLISWGPLCCFAVAENPRSRPIRPSILVRSTTRGSISDTTTSATSGAGSRFALERMSARGVRVPSLAIDICDALRIHAEQVVAVPPAN